MALFKHIKGMVSQHLSPETVKAIVSTDTITDKSNQIAQFFRSKLVNSIKTKAATTPKLQGFETIEINVNVTDNTFHDQFNCKFVVIASYSQSETIKSIIDTINDFLQKQYYPVKVITVKIDAFNSFIHETLHLLNNNLNGKVLNESILNYSQPTIIDEGLSIFVKVSYEHNVSSVKITCPQMISKESENPLDCSIYHAMKEKYEWNQASLTHLDRFTHFRNEYEEKPDCKYKDDCKSYIRLEDGDNKLNDMCHIKLFKHPPRNRNIKLAENIHSLVINKKIEQNRSIYEPTDDDDTVYEENEENGYLNALISEVILNGFERDLCLNNDDLKNHEYSILNIVDQKMISQRHHAMNSPLNRGEMLALILYTGCDCNYDLCSSQRNGDYKKWKWFDYCLYHAIETLSLCEHGSFPVFSGLNNVKLNKKSVENGYFVTYVSTSWNKFVAEAFMKGDGMIIQIDKQFKNNQRIYCCDVSWISKFTDECEILFARSIGFGSDGFKCKVLDETKGVQTISLTATNISIQHTETILIDHANEQQETKSDIVDNIHNIDDNTKDADDMDENLFMVHQRVQCLYMDDNEWYDAIIKEIDNERVLIEYDDYSEEYDEWISKHEWKVRIKTITFKYNKDVVQELVNMNIGTEDECIKASQIVVDCNDINQVMDELNEIENKNNTHYTDEVFVGLDL